MAITKFHGTKWYFIWRYQSSMEFHGTKWYVIWRHQSSMEYSMELIDISFGGTRVPWNSRDYSMEFHGTPVSFVMAPSKFHGIPWNSGDFLFGPSIEFHGIPWYIPWKSRVAWHWIKRQSESSMEFHGTKWYFFWRHQTSMEYSMEFHGTCVIWHGALLILWNPMDLSDYFYDFLFGDSRIPWNSIEYSLEVQGNRS